MVPIHTILSLQRKRVRIREQASKRERDRQTNTHTHTQTKQKPNADFLFKTTDRENGKGGYLALKKIILTLALDPREFWHQ